ncbi:MAG: hypothetical protein ACFFG0_49335 [Candidatus Thorarchaeota archaeon]
MKLKLVKISEKNLKILKSFVKRNKYVSIKEAIRFSVNDLVSKENLFEEKIKDDLKKDFTEIYNSIYLCYGEELVKNMTRNSQNVVISKMKKYGVYE